MTFQPPDLDRFPAIPIARAAGEAGPGATAALIAADDIAVERFLAGELSYPGMARLVAGAIERYSVSDPPGLEELEAIDGEVRAWASAVSEGALA